MVRTKRIQQHLLLTLGLTETFLFSAAAIYLAKRNIRKKGILELHEQVREDCE